MLPLIVPFAVLVLIWPEWMRFYAGAALGAAVAMYVCLLDSPPEWIERKRRGREGERRTERQLRALEREGWIVIHDVLARRGNLDHVVVGMKGAYLLETKCFHGRVAFDGDELVLRRGDDERDTWRPDVPLDRAMRGAAADLKRELAPAGVRWVDRVVVLWSEFDEGVVEVDGTTYLHGTQLAGWLRNGRDRLSPQTVEDAAAVLRDIKSRGSLRVARSPSV